jgi:hypothetical protein
MIAFLFIEPELLPDLDDKDRLSAVFFHAARSGLGPGTGME